MHVCIYVSNEYDIPVLPSLLSRCDQMQDPEPAVRLASKMWGRNINKLINISFIAPPRELCHRIECLETSLTIYICMRDGVGYVLERVV
jgi:hypothetical protein